MLMKKILTVVVLTALLSSLTGCGSSAPATPTPPENPFSFDKPTPTAAEGIRYYTENDTYNTLTDSTPYYLGNKPNPDLPGLVEYTRLKQAKITEAQQLTADLFAATDKVQVGLAPYRGAFLDLVGALATAEKKFNKTAYELSGQLTESLVQEAALKANYESVETGKLTNPQAKTLFDYQKTYLAIAYANAVLNDVNTLWRNGAVLSNLAAGLPAVSAAGQTFDSQMEGVSALANDVQVMVNKTLYLGTALKQINTGDYYLAQASLEYIKSTYPEIQSQAGSLTASANLTAEDIQAVQEYTAVVGDFSQQLDKELQKLDTSKLIPADQLAQLPAQLPAAPWGIPTAIAAYAPPADTGLLKSYQAISGDAPSTTGKIVSGLKDAASATWSGIKTGVGMAQTGVGVTLDTVGAVIKTPADVVAGIANGNSVGEIAGEVGNNFVQIKKNYDADKSGAQILKDAGEMLKGVEQAAGGAAEGLTEKLVGKGYTSWIAGQVASTTVGLFTGLGKGIYKLANKESTAGEMAEGMLDVGLSLIGGSKVIIKGSQALAGGKELAKWSADKAFTFLRSMGNKLEQGQLKAITAEILQSTKLTPNQVLSLISNSLEMEGKEAIAAEIKAVSASLDEKFVGLMKEGINTVLRNASTVPGASYEKWVKTAFENSMKGLKDAMIARLGSSYTDYIDNILAAKMNGWIKTAIKMYIDAVGFDGIYSKNFPADKITIPVKVTVENGMLSGGLDFTYVNEGWSATNGVSVEGTLDEKGNFYLQDLGSSN